MPSLSRERSTRQRRAPGSIIVECREPSGEMLIQQLESAGEGDPEAAPAALRQRAGAVPKGIRGRITARVNGACEHGLSLSSSRVAMTGGEEKTKGKGG